MFLSRNYAAKLWTNHEREAAQARAFRENEEYILPIRLDDTEIPGILQTTVVPPWDWTPGKVKTRVYTIGKKGVQNGTTTEIYRGVQSTTRP